MQHFISKNWYKLMIGSSLLMASFGFMLYSVKTASANESNNAAGRSYYQNIPVNPDGSISVKLSDEQLRKIIPINPDGSLTINLSDKQFKALTPQTVQSVNLVQINGNTAGCYSAYTLADKTYYGLATREISPW